MSCTPLLKENLYIYLVVSTLVQHIFERQVGHPGRSFLGLCKVVRALEVILKHRGVSITNLQQTVKSDLVSIPLWLPMKHQNQNEIM